MNFWSGLLNAGTSAATGALQGQDAAFRARVAEAARQAAAARQARLDQQDYQFKSIAALTAAASAGVKATPTTAPTSTVSRRAATGTAPVSPEGGRPAVSVSGPTIPPDAAQPVAHEGDAPPTTDEGMPIGEVAGVRLSIPSGGLQSRTAREAEQKAAHSVAERQAQIDAYNAGLDPSDPKSARNFVVPKLAKMLSANEPAFTKWLEQRAGLGAPDPIATHRANRDYDVAHPMPERQGSSSAAENRKTTQTIRLSGQFDSDPIIKNAKEVALGMAKVRAAATDPSPAGDLALLYGYNKLLDPGSVVRESEFATAAKSGSLPQQIQAAAYKVVNGQRLTPQQRADFIRRADLMAHEHQQLVGETITRHSARASRMGADPRDVVYDPFEGTMGGGLAVQPHQGSAPKGDIDLGAPRVTPTTTKAAGAPPKGGPATSSSSMSDADLWETFVNGGMSPDAATRAVQSRRRP